jgi:hypothetical protein
VDSWACCQVRYLIRDRDGTYLALLDTILAGPADRGASALTLKDCRFATRGAGA